MRYQALIVLAMLLLASSSYAAVSRYVSQGEAESFVSIQNAYLKPGETASADYLVKSGNSLYWVVTIKRGESPLAFVAVKDAEQPEIVTDEALNGKLFEVAYVLWSFGNLEDAFKRQNNWFFTLTNLSSFRDLSQFLSNENEDLEFIKSAVVDLDIQRQVNTMKSKLGTMTSLANDTAEALDETIALRNAFYSNPSTEGLNEFINAFSLENADSASVIALLGNLVSEAIDYDTKEVTALKDAIAVTTLDLGEKDLLINKAGAPFSVSSLTGLRSTLTANKQSLDEAFLGLLAQKKAFVDDFESRHKMNQAYQKLYSSDEGLRNASDRAVSSLNQAAQDILAVSKRDYWADQDSVRELESAFNEAQTFYSQENYAAALASASDAVDAAKKVYQSGFASVEQEPLIDEGLLQQAVIALAALLVVLIAYRYRKKLANIFKPKEEVSGEFLEEEFEGGGGLGSLE